MPDLTYEQFLKTVTDFGQEVTANAESIRAWAAYIDEEAKDTSRVAEMIGARRVDRDTIAETEQLAKIMAGVSEQAIQYAARGDTTARFAQASHDQAKDSHQGIHEAVNNSPAVGIHDVDSEWLAKE